MKEIKGFKPEEQEGLKAALTEIETALGTKMADQVKTAIEVSMKGASDEIKGLKEWKVTAEEAAVKNQAALDDMIAKGKKSVIVAPDHHSFGSVLAKAFEENGAKLATFKDGRTPISFMVKAVGNMGSGNFTVSGTQGFVNPQQFGGVGRKPYEMTHVRGMVSSGPLGATTDVYVIRDASGEGGPTTVAAAAAKPQSDRDYTKTIVPVTKIAHYYKIPEEYLADIPWLQSEITGVGIEEIYDKEDTYFLTNSTSGEFKGLNQTFNSTAFAAPSSLALLVPTPTNYDALVAAWTQVRNLKNKTTGVMVHPSDYAAMILAKSSTGEYIFGAPNQAIPNLFGAPIVPHTSITSDKFFVGDFTKAKIGQRADLSVRIYDQNEDDAIKNMVTIVIEERVTFAVDRADRIVYGDFSDAVTALTKP